MDEDDPKRRKPADKRKSLYLRVRITPAQDERIRAAADRSGIGVSSWVIDRLTRSLLQEERSAAAPLVPPSVPEPTQPDVSPFDDEELDANYFQVNRHIDGSFSWTIIIAGEWARPPLNPCPGGP